MARTIRTGAAIALGLALLASILSSVLQRRAESVTGLMVEVFATPDFGGQPVFTGTESFGLAALEDRGLPARHYSVRWRGIWHAREAGSFTFRLRADDRARLAMDGVALVQVDLAISGTGERTIPVSAGLHAIEVEFVQLGGGAALSLLGTPEGGTPAPLGLSFFPAVPRNTALATVRSAELVGGISRLLWSVFVAMLALVVLDLIRTLGSRTQEAIRRWAPSALAVAAGAALIVGWTEAGRMWPPTGDEPHYLIMAASVLRDADLDLENNYEYEAEAGEIRGPMGPHVIDDESGRWYPYHTPGLGFVLAIPFGIAGTLGARVAMCLFAALIGWACWRRLRGVLSASDASLATAGLLFCIPVCFGGSQIYPDLCAGAVVLALAVRLWDTSRWSRAAWAGWWLVAGLLPWLHVKYLAPAGVLAVLGIWRLWRQRGSVRRESIGDAAPAALFLVGIGSLAWFQITSYSSFFGGRAAELASTFEQRLEVFLGLHLDQAEGMFLQQPLLIPGVFALGYMIRRRHPLTFPWLLLYGSLIVPNTMQSSWYGAFAPVGRFGWPAMWLWIVPISVWLAAERGTIERYVRPVVLTGLLYQTALAMRWVPSPFSLIARRTDDVLARASLFPGTVRHALPSFYFRDLDGFLAYLPNVVWVSAAVLLIATGILCTSSSMRARLRTVWTIGLVSAMIVLPAEPAADLTREDEDEWRRRTQRDALSSVRRRFEAEWMAPMGDSRATTVPDSSASAGQARIDSSARADGMVLFGPWIALEPGRYRVEFVLRLMRPSSADRVARLDVTANRGRTVIGAMDVSAADLRGDGWTRAAITFGASEVLEDVEFRVAGSSDSRFAVDYVDLIPILPRPPDPGVEVVTEIPASGNG